MLERVTIQKMAEMSGFTVSALRSKIQRGELLEGKHYFKKGRRVTFDVAAFNEWIKQ